MKISVITASYNYAQYIEEAINSVINQTYSDWELIIVDDGSSDNSVEIIKKYCEKDERIKFFQHQDGQNKGLKETLLLGISKAKGDWIAFLESDDYFTQDNLLKKVEIINNNIGAKLIFNRVEFLLEDKNLNATKRILEKRQKKLSKQASLGLFPKDMFYNFYVDNMILTFSCVAVESDLIKKIDFNSPVDTMIDWWLWIHLAYQTKFYYIDEALTNWRLHDKSYILTGKKPKKYFVPVFAYNDVYSKNKSFKLLIFIIYSMIVLFFVRLARFVKKEIKKKIFRNKY